MPRRASVLAMLCLTTVSVAGQDLENLQIHGFATQGLLYSTNNNYLTMKSSSGSLQWTEGAVSFSDAVTDKLRIGVQLHMYQMGEFGGRTLWWIGRRAITRSMTIWDSGLEKSRLRWVSIRTRRM